MSSLLTTINRLQLPNVCKTLCQVVGSQVSALQQNRTYYKDPKRARPGKVFGETQTKVPIYYDYWHGERTSDPDALIRFFRLHWGGWIHTKPGRRRALWKKQWDRQWWGRQHTMCSDDQCDALEKMITPEYKKARHFVNDPYKPYHKRHGIDVLPRGKDRMETHYLKLLWEY